MHHALAVVCVWGDGLRRDSIDFHEVLPRHEKVHMRLENWAMWAHGKPQQQISPMFRLYRSDQMWSAPEVRPVVDVPDAIRMERGIVGLPERHRHALQWCYVIKCTPIKACRAIGVTARMLGELVADARSMLVNRGH